MKKMNDSLLLNRLLLQRLLPFSSNKAKMLLNFILIIYIVAPSTQIPIETPPLTSYSEIPGQIPLASMNFQEDGSPIIHAYEKSTDEFVSYIPNLPSSPGPITFVQTTDKIPNPNGTSYPYKMGCIRSLQICHSSRSFYPTKLWLIDMKNYQTQDFFSVFKNSVSYKITQLFFDTSTCSQNSSYCYFLINY